MDHRLLLRPLTGEQAGTYRREPLVVRFDGLLDELHVLWPLEDDEGCQFVVLAVKRAELDHRLGAA